MDDRRRFRLATIAAAVVLSWFSLVTILAEALTPAPPEPAQSAAQPPAGQMSDDPPADWLAAAAPLRGDLLADVALARAIPVIDLGTPSASSEVLARRESALALAQQSLAFAPHASRAWLLIAMLQAGGPLSAAAIEALKMSYLTAPSDPDLIPGRLAVLATSTTTEDELASLARGDIRLILTRRPELKGAIVRAYDKGSTQGKALIREIARALDPNFAATLH
jgi:hypothetical protein